VRGTVEEERGGRTYSHVERDISLSHDHTIIVTFQSTTCGTLISRDDLNGIDISSAIRQLPQLFDRLTRATGIGEEGWEVKRME
jgi:hypothetical protein